MASGDLLINGNLKVQNKYEVVTDFNKYGFAGIKKMANGE